MAKKLGKILAVAAIASAAAGAYYYYKSKTESSDYDDFDDFESEDDSSLDDYLKEEAYQSEQTERSLKDIFPINLSSDTVNEARETLKKAVLDIGEKVADVAESVTGVVKSSASDVPVEDFKFYDLSKDKATPADGASIDVINTEKHTEEAASEPAAAAESAADISEPAAASEPAADVPEPAAASESAADTASAGITDTQEEEKSAGEILFSAEESSGDLLSDSEASATDSEVTEEFKFDE